MKSKSLVVVLTVALLGALVFAGPVTAAPVTLSATLNGANEVNGQGQPNQGDPDGTGTAQITLDSSTKQVCFDITVTNIELPAHAAHIHKAPAGKNGGIKVTLAPPGADGHSNNCVNAGRKLIKKIQNNPSEFYVNVHTHDFPSGAVRGQLSNN